jgi:hypothetical protein
MPFDTRCPHCNAKLRFDEPPDAGEPIECPKCEKKFPAPPQPRAAEPSKDEPKKKQIEPRKVTAKERVHFNPILLLLIVGTLVSILIVSLGAWWWMLYKAGKAEEMLAAVPQNFNVLHGVNMKAMKNYQKLKAEQDKYYTQQAAGYYSDAAKKLGMSNPDGNLRYFIAAREARGGNSPTLMLFLTNDPFDPADLGGGQVKQLSGGASVCCPSPYIIAVAFNGNEASNLSAAADNIRQGKPKDAMHTKVGTAGLMAIRGHIWAIIRPTGNLQNYFKESAEAIKQDGELGKLRESFGSASLFASWTSFGGGGVRLGAAINCADSDAAKALVKDMRNGPLGKGDESEPPNNTKQVFNFLTMQKEFLQYLEYRSSGECAYLISKMENPEKAKPAMDQFTKAERAGAGAGFSGMMGSGR